MTDVIPTIKVGDVMVAICTAEVECWQCEDGTPVKDDEIRIHVRREPVVATNRDADRTPVSGLPEAMTRRFQPKQLEKEMDGMGYAQADIRDEAERQERIAKHRAAHAAFGEVPTETVDSNLNNALQIANSVCAELAADKDSSIPRQEVIEDMDAIARRIRDALRILNL